MKLFYALYAAITGRNPKNMPVDAIKDQLMELRPLPLGATEFEDWCKRIISGAQIEGGEENPEAFINSQKYILANMIMQLGPIESHKPDAHFIHGLRKVAANQVADTFRRSYFDKRKAELECLEREQTKEELECLEREQTKNVLKLAKEPNVDVVG